MKFVYALSFLALTWSMTSTAASIPSCSKQAGDMALAISDLDGTHWGILNIDDPKIVQDNRGAQAYSYEVSLHPQGTNCGGAWYVVTVNDSCQFVSIDKF
jgi:hypothetical protein